MNTLLNKVKKFRRVFGLGISDQPTTLDNKTCLLLSKLMDEENSEYLEAVEKKDIVGIADALGDMLYVLLGTILEHGLQDKIEQIFNEIHQSNMSKLGLDGNPIYREDGKVIKGPNYFRPNILKIIRTKSKVRIDYNEVKDVFNSVCVNLSKVTKINSTRKSLIDARAKEYDLNTIGEVFVKVSKNPFLNGKNNAGWKANFDWIMKSSNFLKILENNYERTSEKDKELQEYSRKVAEGLRII